MTLITAELLHEAADVVAMLDHYPEDAEIEKFIGESEFPNYEGMDEASLAYGISVGIQVMLMEVTTEDNA